jgi:hypothetical protein
MTRAELERLLQSYEPLKGVSVTYPSAFRQAYAPKDVTIQGVVYVHGEPFAYETEVSLDFFNSPQDVERLIGGLMQSFEIAHRKTA